MKTLGMADSSPALLASYTKNVISGPLQTGWGSPSKSIDKLLDHYHLAQKHSGTAITLPLVLRSKLFALP